MAAVVVSGLLLSIVSAGLPSLQAQFIISPDLTFSEIGTVSKIDYRDRFKQYKKFIIRNIDAPGTKALMARLNAELFRTYSPGQSTPLSTGEQEVSEEEDFSRAFQNRVVLSTSPTHRQPLIVTNNLSR